MKNFLYILILSASIVYSQADWQKWEAKEVSYLLPTKNERNDKAEQKTETSTALSFLKNVYSFSVSDYDGDNCPFHPTCANFFVEAVEETNFLSGLLMFADRFTRDMNFLKDTTHYTLHKNGKYFDPPGNYTLNLHQIKFKPDNND